MFSAIYLLVLASAITIKAQGQEFCSETKIGIVPTHHPVILEPVVLEPFVVDYKITVPPIPECTKGVSGVHAYICDPGQAPAGYFTDNNTLKVHRGFAQGYGSVTVTVYCTV